MTIYDTSKDSDGGAWTKRCQQTSWFNETLAGKWLGPQDTEFQARNAGSTISATELVTNGTFDTDVSGWLTAGCTVSKSGNAMRITDSDGATGYAYRSVTLEIGKTYLASVRVTLDAITGSLTLYMGTTSGSNQMGSSSLANGPGTISFYFTATATTGWIAIRNITAIAGEYWEVDNVSVREVTALTTASNDYFQLTTDGKFYRLWKNLLSRSAEFDNVAWVKSNVTASGMRVTAGSGTFAAYLDRALSLQPGGSYSLTVIFPNTPGRHRYIWIGDRGTSPISSATFDLDAVSVIGNSTSVTARAATLNDGSVACTISYSRPSGSIGLNVALAGAAYTPDRPSLVWAGTEFLDAKVQLEYGSTATTYEPKGSEGTTSEIFRGNKAEFPKLAAIVAEATSVNIYDLTEPGRPMWMRFLSSAANNTTTTRALLGANTQAAIAALNGILATGATANSGYQGSLINFPADSVPYLTNGVSGSFRGDIARRNEALGFNVVGGFSTISGTSINAVAMTVLPDAPIDPATGLRVPTIAVATGGGVSVIKHNGTVVNSSSTTAQNDITIDPYVLAVSNTSSSTWFYALSPGNLGASFTLTSLSGTAGPSFGVLGGSSFKRKTRGEYIRRSGTRVNMLKQNEGTMVRALTCEVHPTFNTGWMTGDIRRAYLSDSSAGTAPQSGLLVNGDFSTSEAAPWSIQDGNVSLAIVSGELQVTFAAGGGSTYPYLILQTRPGYRYTVTSGIRFGTGVTSVYNEARDGGGGSGTGLGVGTALTADGTLTYSFTAISSLTSIRFTCAIPSRPATIFIDNVVVTNIAEPDRSYKAALANITGTITKAQLASGTSLVGYSGYSASNYLREPYSADLDFGTGEFTATAWVNIPATLPVSSFPNVGSELVTNGTFDADVSGWSEALLGGASLTWASGEALLSIGTGGVRPYQVFSTVVGRSYRVKMSGRSITADTSGYRVTTNSTGSSSGQIVAEITLSGSWTRDFIFVATATSTTVAFLATGSVGQTAAIDNVSVREVGPAIIAAREFSSGPRIRLGVTAVGYLTAEAFDGTTTRTVTTTAAYNTATWLKARVRYTTDGSLAITVNGREVAVTRGTPLASMTLGKNMISQSESFDLAPWNNSAGGTGVACVVTSNAGNDPNGNPAADRIQFNLGGGTVAADFTRRIQAVNTPATAHVFSIYVKSYDGTSTYSMHIVGPTGATTAIAVTGSWQRFEVTGTGPGSNLSYAIGLRGGQTPTNDNTADVLVWGAQVETGSTATAYAATNVAPLTIGNSYALDAPFPGSIALLKLGATVPTTEQAQFMYEQEKQLFRAGAQSVLPDSGSILDMAYDDATDRWVAVSGTNESYWTGLVRNNVVAVPAGTYTRVVANSGVELNSRITTNPGVDVSIPAYGLREELVRRSEAASRLGKELATYDYVGGFTGNITTGSTTIASVAGLTYPTSYIGARISGTGIPTNATIVAVSGTTIYISAAATATTSTLSISFFDFILPAGMEAKTVMSAGAVKQEGSTKDYTRLYDGFLETIRFAAAPGVTAWVQIQAQRIAS
jgi:hypothetical protein